MFNKKSEARRKKKAGTEGRVGVGMLEEK